MMGKLKEWAAREQSVQWGSNDRKLVVEGHGTITNSSQKLVLREAVPQGINPATLILDLTVVVEGDNGSTVMLDTDIETFEKPVADHQYTTVTVRGAGSGDINLDVQYLVS